MTDEEKGLIEDVGSDRRATPKRIYADWLEDHAGGQPKLERKRLLEVAHAYRWAAAQGLHPHVTPARRHAAWRRADERPRRFDPAAIHHCLFELLPRWRARGEKIAPYRDVSAAFGALAIALSRLNELYRIKE